MTRSLSATRALPQPYAVGALMLGAALALVPLVGHAQDTNPPAAAAGDTAAPSPEAAAGAAPSPEAQAATASATEAAGQMPKLTGIMRNAEGAEIGNVVISETASGAFQFVLDLTEGALPAATHGLHIHETGLCEAPDFKSAGGHLADGKEHGIHSAKGAHPGDLPNITMGATGPLHAEYFMTGISKEQLMDEDGSAVMIHADVDDYASQPAGNAGDRIACAVLEQAS